MPRNCSICADFQPRSFPSSKFWLLEEVAASAVHGCPSCSLAYEISMQAKGFWGDSLNAGKHIRILPDVYNRQEDSITIILRRGRDADSQKHNELTLEAYTHPGTWPVGSPLRLPDIPDEYIPWKIRRAKDICMDAGSAIRIIQDKLRQCREKHTGCRSRGPYPGLPTRVLDLEAVDASGQICPRLVQLKGLNEPYVALSHCWGIQSEAEMPLTTTLNIGSRENAIPIAELPLTFRQAIILTRKLHIRYLWIDSLCILQNDTEDWEKESLQMASIYEKARLVISAAAAQNCNRGLFSKRVPPETYKVHFTSDLSWNVYTRAKPHHGDFTRTKNEVENPRTNPLFSRAWAFQERLSARRAVHFCTDEIVWECDSEVWCECGALEEVGTMDSFKMHQSRILSAKPAFIKENPRTHLAHLRAHWEETIRQFTRRQLTFDSDRLPALSSLAQRISTKELGKYYAGIWKSSLYSTKGLWWRRLNLYKDQSKKISTTLSHYCAPTWSWASVSGEIEPDGVTSLWSVVQNGQMEELLLHGAQVVDIDCCLMNPDLPFSSVTAGHLTIDASYSLESAKHICSQIETVFVKNDECGCSFYPDTHIDLQSSDDGRRLTCLWLKSFISNVQANGTTVLIDFDVIVDVALVVEKSTISPECYERRGLYIVRTSGDGYSGSAPVGDENVLGLFQAPYSIEKNETFSENYVKMRQSFQRRPRALFTII